MLARSVILGGQVLEPVCCKKPKKKFLTSYVPGLNNREPRKDLNDSQLIVYGSKQVGES